MKCHINVFMLNEHFSQEHADANFGGKPSANNRLYDWEDEMRITSNVVQINEHRKASFPLQGVLPDGKEFKYDVTNMFLFEIVSDNGPTTYIGCSESILDSFENTQEGDTYLLKLFIRDYEAYANPIPGIYIASQEFPKELIF